MRRSTLLRHGALLLVFLLPTCLRAETGTLSYLFGRVERRGPGEASWTRAREGEAISIGTELRTLRGARAELRLAGGELLRLEERSHLTVPSSKHNTSVRVSVVKLFLGSVWCRVKKLARGESFQVQTPTAVGGVKGTLFVVEHDERTGRSSMQLLEGRIRVMAAAAHSGAVRSIVLRPGQGIRVERSAGLGRPRPVDAKKLRMRYDALVPMRRGDAGGAAPAPAEVSKALGAFLAQLRREVDMEERQAVQVKRLARQRLTLGAKKALRHQAMIDRFVDASRRREAAVATAAARHAQEAPPELLRLLKRFRDAHVALMEGARGEKLEEESPSEGHALADPTARGRDGSLAPADSREGLDRRRAHLTLQLCVRKIEGLERRLRSLPIGPPAPKPPLLTFVRAFQSLDREARAAQRGIGRDERGSLDADLERARAAFVRTLKKVEDLVKLRYEQDATGARVK